MKSAGRVGDRGRVHRVVTGDRLEQGGGVAHVAGERAHLVEGGGEGDQAVAADQPVGRLDADDAAQGRRLADRAAGVGADPERGLTGGHGRGRPAAGAARHPGRVPGVAGRPEPGVLGGGAHGELVHVGLAEDHDPGVAQPADHGGVVRRHELVQDPRPGGGPDPLGHQHVLEGQGHPGQRAEPLAPLPGRVDLAGRLEGLVAGDGQEGVQPLVGGRDPLQGGLGGLDGRRRPPANRSASSWAVRSARDSAALTVPPR